MKNEEQKPITFDDLKNSSNSVYKSFFLKNSLVETWANKGLLFNSIWKGELSKNSFCLKKRKDYGERIPQILIDRFSPKNEMLFRTKYQEAISGDGKEWTRITTLHSSSLLALLFFYNVTDENKLTINKYTFNKSYFEVKTHVHDDSESNMDVVLRGIDNETGNAVVLFLECKFSEYLEGGRYDNISYRAYYEVYKQLGLIDNEKKANPIDLLKFTKEDNLQLIIEPSNPQEPIYCGGIKQMISHYIGVRNYSVDREKSLAEHNTFKADSGEKVLLGEILYNFADSGIIFYDKKRLNYKNAYNKLAQIINEQKNPNFEMLPDIMTYQEVLGCNPNYSLNETICRFYSFETK